MPPSEYVKLYEVRERQGGRYYQIDVADKFGTLVCNISQATREESLARLWELGFRPIAAIQTGSAVNATMISTASAVALDRIADALETIAKAIGKGPDSESESLRVTQQ